MSQHALKAWGPSWVWSPEPMYKTKCLAWWYGLIVLTLGKQRQEDHGPCWAASLAYLAISSRTHSNRRLYCKRAKQMVSIEGMLRLSLECIHMNSNIHNWIVLYTLWGTNHSQHSWSLRIRVYKVGGSGLGERVEGGRNQCRFDKSSLFACI